MLLCCVHVFITLLCFIAQINLICLYNFNEKIINTNYTIYFLESKKTVITIFRSYLLSHIIVYSKIFLRKKLFYVFFNSSSNA